MRRLLDSLDDLAMEVSKATHVSVCSPSHIIVAHGVVYKLCGVRDGGK